MISKAIFFDHIDSLCPWISRSIVLPPRRQSFHNGAGSMLKATARVGEARRRDLLSEMLRIMQCTHSEHADCRSGSRLRAHLSTPKVSTKIRPRKPRVVVTPHLWAVTDENSVSRSVSNIRPRRQSRVTDSHIADRTSEHPFRFCDTLTRKSSIREVAGWMITRWRPSSTVPVWTGSPRQS